MLQVSPELGRGRTSAVTMRAQEHLLTLLDVRIYTNLRETERFKDYIPRVLYRREKKYIFFPSWRISAHTLMRRTMYNFLALQYIYSPKVYQVGHT